MTNRQLMLKALNKKVIPSLLEQGFVGKYPDFRREKDDCIEFIGFQTNKWGGSFTIEVSAIFPNSKHNNCLGDTIAENVWGTSNCYRLDGMFDGWFYYSDVYLVDKNFYTNINEKESKTFIPPKHYKLVQKFTPEAAENICDEINKQFKKAFILLDEFENSDNKEFFQFDDCENNDDKKLNNLLNKIKTILQDSFKKSFWH